MIASWRHDSGGPTQESPSHRGLGPELEAREPLSSGPGLVTLEDDPEPTWLESEGNGMVTSREPGSEQFEAVRERTGVPTELPGPNSSPMAMVRPVSEEPVFSFKPKPPGAKAAAKPSPQTMAKPRPPAKPKPPAKPGPPLVRQQDLPLRDDDVREEEVPLPELRAVPKEASGSSEPVHLLRTN